MNRFLVLVGRNPRSVALIPIEHPQKTQDKKALLIKKSSDVNNEPDKSFIDIDYLSLDSQFSEFEYLDIDPIYGTAGLIEYENDSFLILITQVSKVPSCEKDIYKVRQVKLVSLTTEIFDYSPNDLYTEQFANSYTYVPLTPDQEADLNYLVRNFNCKHKTSLSVSVDYKHPCSTLIDFLEKGTMYFSHSYELTKTVQALQLEKELSNSIQNSNFPPHNSDASINVYPNSPKSMSINKFRWNEFLLKVFIQFSRRLPPNILTSFNNSNFTTSLVQGYVGCVLRNLSNQSEYTPNNNSSNADILSIMVISRLSSRRIGTRFLTRGVDDSGNVANNCQTEVIISTKTWIFSYVQIRGSIPLFWNQQGLQIGSHKLQLSRSLDASLPATKRHFGELISDYGKIHIINLVKSNLNGNFADLGSINLNYINNGCNIGEVELGICYEHALSKLNLSEFVGYTGYNFHEMVKGGQFGNLKSLINSLVSVIDRQKFFFKWIGPNFEKVESYQVGVLRTNCLDCLDRTNVIQSEMARYVTYLVLSEYLTDQIAINSNETDTDLRKLLAESGNALSMLYTGTSALKDQVTVTGKSGLAGIFSDASKSIGRFVQGNFGDKNKQVVIDVMTGNNSKFGSSKELFFKGPDYNQFKDVLDSKINLSKAHKKLSIFTTTFNAAGLMYNGIGLGNWLGYERQNDSDILLISLQEVVELNVSSVISADITNRVNWIGAILNYLNSSGSEEYILVSSEQLVGICCIVIAKLSVIELLSNIDMNKVKTGMVAGISGNKGAIGCKLTLGKKHNIFFVAAHLTSGASKEIDRNSDYNYITNNLQTSGSDLVIWAGDLNYRLDLPSSFDAQELIKKKNYASLVLFDQLSYQMNNGAIFKGGYKEQLIEFCPTYKFVKGTSDYDIRADVPRVPSYTDRILYNQISKELQTRQLNYYCCDTFLFSDHKPVCSIFEIEFDYDVYEVSFPNSSVNYELACLELHYGS
ncbi:Inositol-1,4,5-trisphosphate 5-phosphatase 1 [Smittium culicis]|uniref:phosphoinositide 5-phosphatase n=1 Tax=Smittium culicis TaxID=133412 RepID=A0A1R1WYY8_9FUNG|nr:Inositol-1,4,5-trisphosphate 5-phosphatase 1 [Smittium culicis]